MNRCTGQVIFGLAHAASYGHPSSANTWESSCSYPPTVRVVVLWWERKLVTMYRESHVAIDTSIQITIVGQGVEAKDGSYGV